MSIREEIIISCDGRRQGSSWPCGACCVHETLELALALADQRGWKITADGGHYCRDHRHQVAA